MKREARPAVAVTFNPSTQGNSLLWLLYVVTSPFASACASLGVSPNVLTTISNLLSLGACILMARGAGALAFGVPWTLALLFDVADGIVARLSGKSSANGSFYDHFSDKVKVALLFLAIGLRYRRPETWVAGFVALSAFQLLSNANELRGHRALRLAAAAKTAPEAQGPRAAAPAPAAEPSGAKRAVERVLGPQRYDLLRRLRRFGRRFINSFVMLQGNSMLFFLPATLGPRWALAALAWFAILCLHALVGSIGVIIGINRELAAQRVGWK